MFILVTGGSGSGKSEYAENRAVELWGREGRLIYLATMYPFDQESHRRIARHRALREGKHFTTLEQYTGLKNISVPLGSTVLLECMSNLAANEMYREDGAGNPGGNPKPSGAVYPSGGGVQRNFFRRDSL